MDDIELLWVSTTLDKFKRLINQIWYSKIKIVRLGWNGVDQNMKQRNHIGVQHNDFKIANRRRLADKTWTVFIHEHADRPEIFPLEFQMVELRLSNDFSEQSWLDALND